jgi:hypothetical protein
MPILRITLFNIPHPTDQQKLISIYKAMPTTATKVCMNSPPILISVAHYPPLSADTHANLPAQDGKPYIQSVTVGAVDEDQLAQGYSVAAISAFASIEDLYYYDSQCAAHSKLKEFADSVTQGFCMLTLKRGEVMARL